MVELTLLTTKGTMHNAAGLNWGFSIPAHVRKFDAYIPLHIGTIRRNLSFFSDRNSTNQELVFIWDDGYRMKGLFEGTQINIQNGLTYPKQISSTPHKDELGKYFRRRLGIINPDQKIELSDLERYGRTSVTIRHLGDNNYSLDFSI
jgi:hypothetical protein